MTIGPSGRLAYVTNFYSNNVSAYDIDPNSGVEQVQGSPFGTGADPAAEGQLIPPVGSPT